MKQHHVCWHAVSLSAVQTPVQSLTSKVTSVVSSLDLAVQPMTQHEREAAVHDLQAMELVGQVTTSSSPNATAKWATLKLHQNGTH